MIRKTVEFTGNILPDVIRMRRDDLHCFSMHQPGKTAANSKDGTSNVMKQSWHIHDGQWQSYP